MNQNMNFLKLAADRYSVRRFTDKAIDQDDINRILKAGYLAPTACNRQPQRIRSHSLAIQNSNQWKI